MTNYRADLKRRDEQLYKDVMEAEADVKAGRYYTGNFRDVLKQFKEDEARL